MECTNRSVGKRDHWCIFSFQTSGQCQCRGMYSGRTCSDCSDGFWDPLKNGTCVG